VFAVAALLMILGSEDPAARNELCRWTGFCPFSEHAVALNKALYDVGLGGLVSLVFYTLLVRLPEGQRRRRIKRSLKENYRSFKRDCIATILSYADGTYAYDLVDQLADQKAFRDYFQEEVEDGQDRWDRFINKLDERGHQELLTTMEIFRDEIAFVLNNTDIPRDKPFEFFKRLARVIYSNKDTDVGYDSIKPFARFLWSVLSGFDFVSGYRETDIVEEMIRAI
jgi:hypothetical protein